MCSELESRSIGFDLDGHHFPITEYHLAPLSEEAVMPRSPGTMATCSPQEALGYYQESGLLVSGFFNNPPPFPLPYAFLDLPSADSSPFGLIGDLRPAQDLYANSYARATEGFWQPPKEFVDLHRYVRLAKGLRNEEAVLAAKFRPDPKVLTVQGLVKEGGGYCFQLGQALYADAFLWNGMTALRVVSPDDLLNKNPGLSEKLGPEFVKELRELFVKLKSGGWEGKSVGQIIAEFYEGKVPPFSAAVAPNSVGVSTLIISGENDPDERSVIYVTRDQRYTSVDTAPTLYFPAAGAADYNKATLSLPDSLHVAVPEQAAEEIHQELGMPGAVFVVGAEKMRSYVFGQAQTILGRETGLSIARGGITLSVLGVVSELTRIQKPEWIFRANVADPVEEIVGAISSYNAGSRREIKSVFSMRLKDAIRLAHTPGAESKMHPKLALALLLLEGNFSGG